MSAEVARRPAAGADDIRQLTGNIQAGDEAAFRQFYERYCDRLFRYLIVLTRGDEALARDLLQTTMIKIVRAMTVFEDERRFWSWLATIARNAFFDVARRIQRAPPLVSLLTEDSPDWPASTELIDDSHLFHALDHCLEELDEEERALIDEFYFKEGTHQSLATARNTTPKAVESKLARVRQKLRGALLKRLRDEDT